MVDRVGRNKAADVIEQYLARTITGPQVFGEHLPIASESQDATLRRIVGLAWGVYDDIHPRRFSGDKEIWDYFQRMLLVLRSDGEIISHRSSSWTIRQVIALSSCLLAIFAYIYAIGNWNLILSVWISFGLVSWALSRWHNRVDPEDSLAQGLCPFGSLTDLIAVRKSVPNFRKEPYPRAYSLRFRSPSRFVKTVKRSMLFVLRGVFAPIWLFFQAFPEHTWKESVKLPGTV